MFELYEGETKKSIQALNDILENNTPCDLSEADLTYNVLSNLVTVRGHKDISDRISRSTGTSKNRTKGTGIKLTTNGFILTSYHGIEEYIDEWRWLSNNIPKSKKTFEIYLEKIKSRTSVVDQFENEYPIDPSFYHLNPKLDLALIKAVIPQETKPIPIRLLERDVVVSEEIRISNVTDQIIENQYGEILKTNCSVDIERPNSVRKRELLNSLLTSANGRPGFSGGPITTLDGELVGVTLFGTGIREDGYYNQSGGANIDTVKEFLKRAITKLCIDAYKKQ